MSEWPIVTVLFLAWHCRTEGKQRRILPVGRLVRKCSAEKLEYEFCYIRGLREAMKDGMRPVFRFDAPDGVWRSPELFPLFTSRIMSERRPDYAQFLRDLHVAQERQTDPLQVLVRSEGIKNTDWFEVFGWPDCVEGRLVTHFWLRGLRYDGREERIEPVAKALESGQKPVEFEATHEPNTPTDSNAVKLRTSDGDDVGFLPRTLTSLWHDLVRLGGRPRVVALKHNPPPAVATYRLLCRLEADWPEGYVPFASDERFRPISSEAWDVPGDSSPTELGRPRPNLAPLRA